MASTTERVSAMTFYSSANAPTLDADGMMTMGPSQTDRAVWAEVDPQVLDAGSKVTVLFKGAGPDSFSLVQASFGPGYRLPRHSHSADCLYYVVSGELIMGSRVLTAGDGFFITTESPYAYTAGSDGVVVLEFRTATGFDIKVRDKTVEQWRPVIEAVKANGHLWTVAASA
jgi:quercetin dioxygenase-like cupin family protein